jgi:hypothetical protein
MIIIKYNGGLGNQMFQYACGKALALKHNTSLFSDLSSLNKNTDSSRTTKRSFELLEVFKINIIEASVADLKSVKPILYRATNVFAFKLGFKGIQMSKYFIENKFSYNHNIKKVGKDCYLSGYWQSPKYFDSIASLIRKEFTFYKQLDDKNLEMESLIKRVNSVSLHIRRTDFKNTKSNTTHGICSLEYYGEAIKFISTKIRDPHFFVFSDDINWAKENLKFPYKLTFISGNSGDKSYIDMQLMSVCKHNIIANSSFSWWGAWLNSNMNKIVIAPKNWFFNKELNNQTNDLIHEEWIRM